MLDETHGWLRLEGLHVDGVRVGIYPHEKNGQQSELTEPGAPAPGAVSVVIERNGSES